MQLINERVVAARENLRRFSDERLALATKLMFVALQDDLTQSQKLEATMAIVKEVSDLDIRMRRAESSAWQANTLERVWAVVRYQPLATVLYVLSIALLFILGYAVARYANDQLGVVFLEFFSVGRAIAQDPSLLLEKRNFSTIVIATVALAYLLCFVAITSVWMFSDNAARRREALSLLKGTLVFMGGLIMGYFSGRLS